MELQPINKGDAATLRLQPGETLVLGRSREARINNEHVSRRHAELTCSLGPDERAALHMKPIKKVYIIRAAAEGAREQQQQQRQQEQPQQQQRQESKVEAGTACQV